MEVTQRPPQNRVPGEAKIKQKDFELEKDLTKLPRRELLDLKSRQQKLLENKSWLKKLPDKGEKIQRLHDRVVEALKQKDEIDRTAKLLTDLNLESRDIENIEWEGKTTKKMPILCDSDDEDEDPLAILVKTNSMQKKIVKFDTPENPLITEEDMKEAEELKGLNLDPVLEHVCEIEKLEPDFRFLPYKNVKNRNGKITSKDRDNTAATPPVVKQGTKLLSLRESIEIENMNRESMKKVIEKHTAERLAARQKALIEAGISLTTDSIKLPSNPLSMHKYRLPSKENDNYSDNSDDDSFESALSDDEEEE